MPDPEIQSLLTEVADTATQLRNEVGKVIVGQDQVIEQLFLALFTRGHVVLEGVPGLAKTLLVSTIAKTLNLKFSRIQFTPDLMPSDITGTEVIEEDRTPGSEGKRVFRFIKGPVFANVILADEINRTPPKTQAALLEAMQEHHVTAGGMRHALPQPFFVLATQNPIEQEGTYPLPEAQLDRFMFMVQVDYPSESEELEVVKRTTTRSGQTAEPVLDAEQVLRIQELVRDVPVADHVIQYAMRLVRQTRKPRKSQPDSETGISGTAGGFGGNSGGGGRPDFIKQYLSWGAGPRASQNLVLAAKAYAILKGRTHVTPEDVKFVAHPVLRHRLIVNFNAEADGITSDDVIDQLIEHTPVEGEADAQLSAVVR